jgi:hypothetical protein
MLSLMLLTTPVHGDDKPPSLVASPKRISELIRDLGHRNARKRDFAEQVLIEFGPAAEKQVKEAMKHNNPEIAQRAEYIYNAMRGIPTIEYAERKTVSEVRRDFPPADYKVDVEGNKVLLFRGGKRVGPELTLTDPPEKWQKREGSRSVVSPDGRFCAFALHYEAAKEDDVTDVWVWDIRSGKLLAKKNFSHEVREMAFTEDGLKLLCYVYDDMRSGK